MQIKNQTTGHSGDWHSACGKVILFGEHAVVYGSIALAGAIPDAVRARVSQLEHGIHISIPAWGLSLDVSEGRSASLAQQTFQHICHALGLSGQSFRVDVQPSIPHAAGMGGSAALAVATVRALSAYFDLGLDDSKVNALAFECECLAHGTPSGLDNTLATYGGLIQFQRNRQNKAEFKQIHSPKPISLIAALTGKKGYTAETVAKVRRAKEAEPEKYQALFDQIHSLAKQAISAIESGHIKELAPLMGSNQQILAAIGVSCIEIEHVIALAMGAGACGAKLTGSGDGGTVIVQAEPQAPVIQALNSAGFTTMPLLISAQILDNKPK